ncbi:MAG: GNAT family N-acetyltransferase [Gammaproteobacteria bacterium]
MKQAPTLETERLILRPLELSDAHDVQTLAGEREIAACTRSIPHPYKDGVAEEWIEQLQPKLERGEQLSFAIVTCAATLIGSIGLVIHRENANAELGYWIGKPYWGQGYCSEAASAIVVYGFDTLRLHRIFAHHLTRNPASGRILQKIGMRHEGCHRQHVRKWGVFEDIEVYGLLRSEYAGA